ncbi:MAG: hypothetical protein AAGJ34_13060 [Pseudomonadota bacterium]
MPYHRTLFVFLLSIFFAAFVVWFLDQTSIYMLLTFYAFDDAFYYVEIARRLWEDGAFSFDGLTETNGFHPLWLFLQAPIFAIETDKITHLYIIKTLEVSLYYVAAVLFATARQRDVTAAFCLPILVYFLASPIHYGGMEQAVTVCAVFLCGTLVSHGFHEGGLARAVLLSIAVFAATLARLEYLAFSCAFCALLVVDAAIAKKWMAARQSLIIFGLFIGLTAGFATVWAFVFGHPLPVSGMTKSEFFSDPNNRNFFADLGELISIYRLSILLALGSVVLIAMDRIRAVGGALKEPFFLDYILFGTAAVALARPLYYAWSLDPQHAQAAWYFTDQAILISALAPYIVHRLSGIDKAAHHQGEGLSPASSSINVIALSAVAVLTGAYGYTLISGLQKVPRLDTYDLELGAYHAALGMNAIEHADDDPPVILSNDAGALGYFYDGAVVNIDGLVNSFDYFERRREGTGLEYLFAFEPRFYVNAETLDRNRSAQEIVDRWVSRNRVPQVGVNQASAAVASGLFPYSFNGAVFSYEIHQFLENASGSGDDLVSEDMFWSPFEIASADAYKVFLLGRFVRVSLLDCANVSRVVLQSEVFRHGKSVTKRESVQEREDPASGLGKRGSCEFGRYVPLAKADMVKIDLRVLDDDGSETRASYTRDLNL